jgi:methylenetetrahydrofolate reductase (NADPH)
LPREAYSELMKAIAAGKFVFTGEIQPKKTAHFDDVIRVAKILKGHVVACNVTDNPRAHAYLSSLSAAYILQREVGVEAICQMTVRDRNRLALFSELLGAAALGIRNVLTMSGDHTSLSDNPAAMPVYDLDTAQFVYMVRRMVDEGVDLEGNKIDGKVKLHVGIVGNPNADPLEVEFLKIERKLKVGADFMQTQAVFDVEKAKLFLREIQGYPVPILLGIFPCKSYGVAEFISKNVPGMSVPKEFMEELKKAEEVEDNSRRRSRIDEINVRYFTDFIKEVKRTTHASGIHIMTVGYEGIVKAIVENVER